MAVHKVFASIVLCVSALSFVYEGGVARALEKGVKAPEIKGSDFKGRALNLGSLKGNVVVVDFWASWCAPCKEELPVLEALYNKHKDRGLVVVGVNIDDKKADADRFLTTQKLSFPLVHDIGHKFAKVYEPATMPSSYVIDKTGLVRFVHKGFKKSDGEKLAKEIEALLKE